MKKIFSILLSFILLAVCFTGCNTDTNTDDGKLSIVSTIFPSYDFAKQICGDNAEVTMLLPPGSESHSYEPSPKDIIKIQECDLFIYNGGESDSWVDKILESMDKPVNTLKMMECVNLVEEQTFGEEHEHEDEDEHEEEHEEEYDEHVWTSPKNSIKILEEISKEICKIDDENSEDYKTNTAAYTEKINKLDEDFSDFFETVENKIMIFGDRFPFQYFADAYGLDCHAAFPGCSTETEPSAATIALLIDKVKSANISTVFYIEFSNHKVADSLAESTNTKTALLHSCHNVAKADIEGGTTYVSLMEQNLSTLKEAMK